MRRSRLICHRWAHMPFCYAPYFEEVEGTYWFWPVRGLCLRTFVHPCVRNACIRSRTVRDRILKGLGSRTCRTGPVNRQKIKVAEGKWHSTFLCAEHFYFHKQHLFSCNPLLLCYRVLHMERVGIFDVFGSILRLWSQIWQGTQPPYKIKFWQYWDFIIP